MVENGGSTCCNLICHAEKLQFEIRAKELEHELNSIDELLARRPALDGEPTRYDKILKAINTAKRVDQAEAKIRGIENDRYTIDVDRAN